MILFLQPGAYYICVYIYIYTNIYLNKYKTSIRAKVMYSTYFSGDFYTRTNKLFRCCPSFIIFPYKQNPATGIPQLPNKPEWWHLAKQHQIFWSLQSSEDASWHKYSLMLHENTSTWCMLVRTSPTNSEGCWAASKQSSHQIDRNQQEPLPSFILLVFIFCLGKGAQNGRTKIGKFFWQCKDDPEKHD